MGTKDIICKEQVTLILTFDQKREVKDPELLKGEAKGYLGVGVKTYTGLLAHFIEKEKNPEEVRKLLDEYFWVRLMNEAGVRVMPMVSTITLEIVEPKKGKVELIVNEG